ncbi:MAG TPA: RecX family transcriptional regulator [Beijerinckiaceae bacterium]|nr:RecX family transcriptional regulator [Beijerinckiaceae bacterium]
MPEPRTDRLSTYLQRAALAYLERHASSSENLRRVLRRKLERRLRIRGSGEELGDATLSRLVDEVVATCVRGKLVDDALYAAGKVGSLRRKGGSARAIEARLAAKGVGRAVIATAIAEEGDPAEAEWLAAHARARRRRIGPYRAAERAAFRDKDMGALMRAGFAFDLARRVIDGDALT